VRRSTTWATPSGGATPKTGRAYLGTRPSRKSIRRVIERLYAETDRRTGLLDTALIVQRINWLLQGWAGYFCLGPVSKSYRALDRYTIRRLRRWLPLPRGAPQAGIAPYRCPCSSSPRSSAGPPPNPGSTLSGRQMVRSKAVTRAEDITRAILVLRGQKVLLDAELAALYGVTTARLNQQVRRNRRRFPADFLFELTPGSSPT